MVRPCWFLQGHLQRLDDSYIPDDYHKPTRGIGLGLPRTAIALILYRFLHVNEQLWDQFEALEVPEATIIVETVFNYNDSSLAEYAKNYDYS